MPFVERKLANLAWDRVGNKVVGRLRRVTRVKYADGSGLKYLVRDREGVMVEFPGTTNINSKLTAADIGAMVSIEYKGEDTTRQAGAGRNLPKLFTVLVDDSDKETGDPTQITDEDIPF